MEEFDKKKLENIEYQQKKMFEKMILSATLGIIRGIDIELYTKTTNEMSNFIKDFQEFLMKNNFSNEYLQVLNSFLSQGRKIIKDLQKGESNE